MKTTEDIFVCLTALSVMCACAMAYQTTLLKRNSKLHEIDTIVNELRRELQMDLEKDNVRDIYKLADVQDINRLKGQTFQDLPSLTDTREQKHPLLSAILSRKDNSADHDVDKRQGGWDYDYGLGGGRFGKRSGMFADYSLGGGRFGRDTSHVNDLENDEVVDFENV